MHQILAMWGHYNTVEYSGFTCFHPDLKHFFFYLFHNAVDKVFVWVETRCAIHPWLFAPASHDPGLLTRSLASNQITANLLQCCYNYTEDSFPQSQGERWSHGCYLCAFSSDSNTTGLRWLWKRTVFVILMSFCSNDGLSHNKSLISTSEMDQKGFGGPNGMWCHQGWR